MSAFLTTALGLDLPSSHLTFWHMALRSVIVFVWGLIVVRFADRRLLAGAAGFDVLLWVVLGSVLSRGVNGQAAFFPTLGASAVIVLLHHLLASAACRWHLLSKVTKGNARVLVRNGRPDRRELRRNKITDDDLDESLRLNGGVADLKDVAEARLERNGSVSVLKK